MAPRLESYHRHSLPRAPSVPPPKLYHLSERRKSPHGQTAPRRGRKGNFAKTASNGHVVNMASFSLATARSEEHTSELQSLMRISYAVFCLKKKKITNN